MDPTSTEATSVQRAIPIVNQIYQENGSDPPSHVFLADCPITAAHIAHLCDQHGPEKVSSFNLSLQAALDSNCDPKWIADMFPGAGEIHWLTIYNEMGDCLLETELSNHVGWWAPYEDVVILQRRPIVLHLDEDYLLHCETGPAVVYESGWKIYALAGEIIPPSFIERPDIITIELIQRAKHPMVRQYLREQYGSSRYLAEVGAQVIDMDSVPVDRIEVWGKHLTRALMDDGEHRYLVGTDGSTGQVYVMQVPRACRTCAMAHLSLSGLHDDDCAAQS